MMGLSGNKYGFLVVVSKNYLLRLFLLFLFGLVPYSINLIEYPLQSIYSKLGTIILLYYFDECATHSLGIIRKIMEFYALNCYQWMDYLKLNSCFFFSGEYPPSPNFQGKHFIEFFYFCCFCFTHSFTTKSFYFVSCHFPWLQIHLFTISLSICVCLCVPTPVTQWTCVFKGTCSI